MSAVVKLSPKLPADFETNGLDAQAGRLLESPEELLVAVVWLDTARIVENVDDGTRVPVARVRRIEPLGDVDDVSTAVRDLVGKALKSRTGRTPIPFEDVDVDADYDPDQLELVEVRPA